MKKQYINPTMEVVMMKVQNPLLDLSASISSEEQDNGDALAPEFIYTDF